MTRVQDEAFVLDTHALGEADLIVTLFSEQHGKVRAVARSARRSRRRFGGQLQPLTRVRASWSGHVGRDLQRLEGVETLRSFAEMQADPLRQATCAVLAELTLAFAHEEQADADLFRLLAAVLEALEIGGRPAALLRYFEYWTLRVHGLLPDLESCAECGGPLPEVPPTRVVSRRGPMCEACPGCPGQRELRLHPRERAWLAAVRRCPPAELPAMEPGSGPVLELLLRGALESFAERSFRTYRHFRAALTLPPEGEPR